jgi:amino acid transporter
MEHHGNSPVYDAEKGPIPHASSDIIPGSGAVTEDSHVLKRQLKGRHMQMIAIGGAIGAGLFVGSGGALHNGGPGSLV